MAGETDTILARPKKTNNPQTTHSNNIPLNMNPFNRILHNASAWIQGRRGDGSTTQPQTQPISTTLSTNERLQNEWRYSMKYEERRGWDRYWEMPGRDFKQSALANALRVEDGESDDKEDGASDDVVVQQAETHVEAVWGGDGMGEKGMEGMNDSDEVANSVTLDDNEVDIDSGYASSSPSESPKQQASVLASPGPEPVTEDTTSDGIYPLGPRQQPRRPSVRKRDKTPPAPSDFHTADHKLEFFPPFEPSEITDTTAPADGTQKAAYTGERPVFRKDIFGPPEDETPDSEATSEDKPQCNAQWRGSTLEAGVYMDNTLNDGFQRTGREASFQGRQWMGCAQSAQ